MDASFTEEQRELQDSVRDFVRKQCSAEDDRRFDEEPQYPYELFDRLADAGMLGVFIPEAYGGLGLGPVEIALVLEELTYGSLGAASLLMPTSLASQLLIHGGTPRQKSDMLPRIVRGECRISFGLSEPQSGSDAASLRLRATPDQDGGYLLNGTKMWTTGADVATHLMVAARTDTTRPKHRGISVFLLEKNIAGLTVTPIRTLGPKGQNTCQVFYSDVRASAQDVLGGPEGLNEGWTFLGSSLALERLEMAALAVGLAQRALDDAIAYVKDREAFGQRVSKFQAIQHMVAERATEIEAARSLTYRAAALMASGQAHDRAVTMAKVFATEVAIRTCLDGVQMLGGYGYSLDYSMQRYLRRALVGTIGGGTTQVLRSLIARQLGM